MIVIAALASCNKKSDPTATAAPASAPAKTAEPTAAAPATAAAAPSAAGHCPDGFTYSSKGEFCVKLPAGMQATHGGDGSPSGQHGMDYGYTGEQTGVTITIAPINQYFDENLKGLPKSCGACKGKASAVSSLPNGGGYVTYENNNDDGRNSIESMVKNDKKTIDCNVVRLASSSKPPSEADAFEICKTIQFAN